MFAYVACALAAVAAGVVNAIAGGGTLISFPVMTAVGIPVVRANASNTVALCPGYIGGSHAQRKELAGLGASLRPVLVAAGVGGVMGSVLLVLTSEAAFRRAVPVLILGGAIALALQQRVKGAVEERRGSRGHEALTVVAVFAASVYGGYF